MADSLIKPEVPPAAGLPPKRLIVGIFGGICLVVILFAAFTDNSAAPTTGDGLARESATTLTDKDKADIGKNKAVVLEDANRSGLPAVFKGPVAEYASGSQAGDGSSKALAGAYGAGSAAGSAGARPQQAASSPVPTPMQRGSVAAQPAGEPNQLEAARRVEAINSKMIVLDSDEAGAETKGAGVSRLSALDSAIATAEADAKRAQQAGVGDAASTSALSALVAAAQGGNGPAAAPNAASLNDKFLTEFSDKVTKPGIRPTQPETRYMVMEGTVIPAVLTRDIVSDMPGVITATVTRDVYDSINGRARLICKGTRLNGRYNNDVRFGQSRLLFAFSRMTLLNGVTYDLSGFDGADQRGAAGIAGDVDNHYIQMFGSALLIGLLADRVVKTEAVPSGQVVGSLSATGQILTDTARAQLERGRNVSPTITIPSGSQINVEVRRDLLFPGPTSKDCK